MMTRQLFTATGCIRCEVIKSYMKENGIVCEEYDIKGEGKPAFNEFYKKNRKQVRRGPEGIEFPILFSEGRVRQGLGVVLAHLMAGDALENMVVPSDLCHGWVGGLRIFSRISGDETAFPELLKYLKKNGLKLELEADGYHPELLERVIREGWVDRLRFVLRGPFDLYGQITGTPLAEAELARSLALLRPPLEYRIALPVVPVARDKGQWSFLSVEEAQKAAREAASATGIKTHPFFIEFVPPDSSTPLEPLESVERFKYRTQCRRFLVRCEILNDTAI